MNRYDKWNTTTKMSIVHTVIEYYVITPAYMTATANSVAGISTERT